MYLFVRPDSKITYQTMCQHILEHVQKSGPNMSTMLGKQRPDMEINIWLPKIKCYNINVRRRLNSLGLVSLWPENLSRPKSLSEPKIKTYGGAVIMII